MGGSVMRLKIGQKVKSLPGCLAYLCGDRSGIIENIDGPIIMVKTDQSKRLVPFRSDQLESQDKSTETRLVESAMARFYEKLAEVEGRDFDPLPRSHRARWWKDQMDSTETIEFKSAGATRKR
jgi:hypothetical protein